MTIPVIEPLDPATWFVRVERLLHTAEKLDDEAPDMVIRTAFHLVTLAPGPLRELFPERVNEDAIEAMLECGAYESAMMALIGPQTAYRAERTAQPGIVEVSMALTSHAINGTGRHQTCTLALLKAWARCLVNLAKTARALNLVDLDPHKYPSGSPRSSTEH